MHNATLDILRCPFCGGRLELATSLFHRRDGDEIEDGILGCYCCIFPIVSGIPIHSRIGYYRAHAIRQTGVVYIDGYKQGTSRSAVDQ